jgi:hypothetical protein
MDDLPTQKHGALSCWLAALAVVAIAIAAELWIVHLDCGKLATRLTSANETADKVLRVTESRREDARQLVQIMRPPVDFKPVFGQKVR